MTTYAQGTAVPVQKTRLEIELELTKRGSTRSATMIEPNRAVVYFEMKDRHVQFVMPLPQLADIRKTHPRYSWKSASEGDRLKELEQRHREKWRALLLTIKAKLVSVESGVETFEEAFLAHIVLPGGVTVGQRALPAVAEAYKSGSVHQGFLLGPGGGA